MGRFNAALIYTPPGKNTLHYNMWVTEYSQPHTLAGTTAQAKLFKHFYPNSYAPGAISIKGRVPTQKDYNNLGTFIRNHHMLLMGLPGLSNAGSKQLPLMKLVVDGEGIVVEGFVESFDDGAQRFNVAPEFQLDIVVIKDLHSKNQDIIPAYAMRSAWIGRFVDETQKESISNQTTP